MHVLLEGVVPYEVRLMLVYYIAERKLFTCELLNERIDCFTYPNHESKDRPSPIKARGVLFKTGSLHQSCKPYYIKLNFIYIMCRRLSCSDVGSCSKLSLDHRRPDTSW